jgi:hypothetical protein
MRSVLNWLRTSGLAAVAVVVALTTTTAQAGVIYDTRNLTGLPGATIDSSQRRAAFAFQTNSSGYIINEVAFSLAGEVSGLTGTINVSIFDASGTGSTPGVQIGSDIGTIDAATLTTSFALFSFTGLTRTLSPNTDYYIVQSSSDLTGGRAGIAITDQVSNGIIGGSIGIASRSSSGWTRVANYYVIGYVLASSNNSGGTVPEPTSMAIFGLGALGFAYRNRRKLMK